MFVYVVLWGVAYEGNQLLGVFSDYVKAREFELNYMAKHAIAADSEFEWVEVRKVELNKDYGSMFDVGEQL